MGKICILTPAPGYKEHWQTEGAPLSALLGDQVEFRPWSAAGDLSGFALITPLLAWGYQHHIEYWYEQLYAWEAARLPFANPPSLLRWNTDKGYLFDLAAAGVAIVPSHFAPALSPADLAAARQTFGGAAVVIKPTVSGGADGTYRLSNSDDIPADVLGRAMLIQPVMDAIMTEGEFSLFYFDGQFSHAIIKRPAGADFRVQEQFGGRDFAVDAPADAQALAMQSLATLPAPPLYARVDMVRGNEGIFQIMELELIEPSLFLHHAKDKGAAFAAATRLHFSKGADPQ
jgi:glutathione synthase/RimK-type ligase-like ATP-grasp enzyme